ncbi:hypothetical protein D3C79_984420 [compost metagenome]
MLIKRLINIDVFSNESEQQVASKTLLPRQSQLIEAQQLSKTFRKLEIGHHPLAKLPKVKLTTLKHTKHRIVNEVFES